MRKPAKIIIALIILVGAASRIHIHNNSLQAEKQINYVSYTVQKGDSIYSIAKKHKPEEAKLNNYIVKIQVKNNVNEVIKPGQVLYIPIEGE